MSGDFFGDEELGVFRPAVEAFGDFDVFFAEGFAVGFFAVLFGGAVADVGVDDDEGGLVGALLELLDGGLDGGKVVGVGDVEDVPAVGFEAGGGVFGEGEFGFSFDGDFVGVVEPAEIVELEVCGEGGGFGRDALHHAAVAADGVDVVVEHLEARFVVAGGHPFAGDGHADGSSEALTEGTGGGFDAGGEAVFGVPRTFRIELAEFFDVVERDGRGADDFVFCVDGFDAGEVEEGIEEHGGVAGGEDEAVAVGPDGVLGIEAEELRPERVGGGSEAHDGAGVSGVGFLDGVHPEGADGVDAEFIDVAFVEGDGGGRGGGGCGGGHRLLQNRISPWSDTWVRILHEIDIKELWMA